MFVGLGAYLGLTAFLEVADIRSLVLPRYINDSTAGIHFGRARGPFLEAGADGLALFMCLVACAVARVVWASRLARAAAASAGVLCAIGIVLTLTRQVWVASVLATATTLAIVPSLRRYVVPAVLGSVACAALVIASVPGLQARAQDRAQSVRPVWDRLNSDRAALNMVAERPLLGFGWDSFPTESVNHYRLAAGYPLTTVDRVHNVLLGYAAELGLIGLTLWLATLAAAVSGMTRRGPPVVEPWRSGLIAIVVCWLVVSNFAPLAYAFPNYVLWLWAGIVYGALREPEPGRDRARAVGRSVMVRQPQPA
jgi:O-antigen ligase